MDTLQHVIFLRYPRYPCIGIISGASFMLSTTAFICQVIVDYKAWERMIDKEDRNVVRLRWEILVLTPLEDLVPPASGNQGRRIRSSTRC